MKKRRKWKYGMLLLALCFLVFRNPKEILAEDATVTFGSSDYEATDNETFSVGVYIRSSEARIGAYDVKITYDNRRLSYVGGGESEENGVITLSGEGSRSQVKYMLKFKTLSGGTADIAVTDAQVFVRGENAAAFDVTEMASTYVAISGEDIVGDLPEEDNAEMPEEQFPSDIPMVGETEIEGKTYYIVDLSAYVPQNTDFLYDVGSGSYGGTEAATFLSADGNIMFYYLMDEQENLYLYAYSKEKDKLYPCNSLMVNGIKYYFMSPYVCAEWPETLTLDIIQSESIVYAMDLNGESGFYKITTGNKLESWNEQEGQEDFYQQMITLVMILAITLLIMILAILLVAYMDKNRKKSNKMFWKKHNGQNSEIKDLSVEDLEVEDFTLDVTEEEILAWKEEAAQEKGGKTKGEKAEIVPAEKEENPPVISVQNVTMQFRIAMNNVSGIKEYLIQLLKKQISYRELLALDHISFDVYKGEVIGIIGTNGSGKSTLLKIVSGALKPSSGQVVCDRRKVQLLTLGTGFDMELTAKENVYLNGAIIGYSKEFIDEKYDEIVKFAELEGFMEEKVKNFSSGMVSRLGFAIATIGETAEILILDEVLSVGDEFFRKKSLARVKEMIHGGSTVLMVSHSLGTIMENCTRVVWIEKGKLRMVGEPKEVCAKYRKMNEGK